MTSLGCITQNSINLHLLAIYTFCKTEMTVYMRGGECLAQEQNEHSRALYQALRNLPRPHTSFNKPPLSSPYPGI